MLKTYQHTAFWIPCLVVALLWHSEAAAIAFDVREPHQVERSSGAFAGKDPWGRLVVRSTFFREMARGAQSRGCEANKPPEPLATPDPVLDSVDNVQLTVSFVVGIDGHVYGPLVLEGTREGVKVEQARPIVDAVRLWRFRPAVCNGAPAEAEARVEFSSAHNRF
jgi:hypothetical protein